MRFTWKQFGTTQEEEMERARLHADLDSMQALEQAALDKVGDGKHCLDQSWNQGLHHNVAAHLNLYHRIHPTTEPLTLDPPRLARRTSSLTPPTPLA